MAIKLPSLRQGAAWSSVPPDPLERPELYDGVIARRVMGFFCDIILIGILWGALAVVLTLVAVFSFGLLSPLLAVLPLLGVIYHTYFIGGAGATPGMKLMDLDVRTWTGGTPGYAEAFVMTAIFYVTVPATTGLILLIALFTDRNRTVHDLLSGTVVVRGSALAQPARVTI